MKTLTKTRATRQPQRTVNVSRCVDGSYAMKIVAGGKSTGYWMTPLTTDWGRGWQLDKFLNDSGTDETERSYSVLLEDGGESICSCKGHQRHGHCRHVSAIEALLRAGRIN